MVSNHDSTVDQGSLAHTIRQARVSRGLTQRAAAELIECTPQHLSQLEQGHVPSIELLVKLHERLIGEHDTASMAQWLAAWVAAKVAETPDRPPVLNAAVSLLRARTADNGPKHARRPLRSLADFPGDDPLTIIVGDRRENPAHSSADCFIYTGSTIDLMDLPALGSALATATIVPDKLFTRMSMAYLREQPHLAESNLLVLGSPAVNWCARLVNDGAVFPFALDRALLERDRIHQADSRMQIRPFASVFWRSAQAARGNPATIDKAEVRAAGLSDVEEGFLDEAALLAERVLAGSTAKVIMNTFRGVGIRDPADGAVHGTSNHFANDFAVVTLARNPFAASDRYRAVLSAGQHGPGTVGALRELLTRTRETFTTRPLGAVIEVELRLDLDWPNILRKVTINRQTNPYTAQSVRDRFIKESKTPQAKRTTVFRDWDDGALEVVAEFLGEVTSDQDSDQ